MGQGGRWQKYWQCKTVQCYLVDSYQWCSYTVTYNANAPKDLLHGLWHVFPRIDWFCLTVPNLVMPPWEEKRGKGAEFLCPSYKHAKTNRHCKSNIRNWSLTAVNPTNSLPANAKAAIIKTLQKPFHPWGAAPGSYQLDTPRAWPLNPSPISMHAPKILMS